jgi:hypothetical protein
MLQPTVIKVFLLFTILYSDKPCFLQQKCCQIIRAILFEMLNWNPQGKQEISELIQIVVRTLKIQNSFKSRCLFF